MSRVSIECPHCGKTTRLDLAHHLSTQKCDRCGIAFRAVNTGLAGSREAQSTEPPDWRRAKTGNWDLDPDEAAAQASTAATAGSRRSWIAAALALVVIAVAAVAVARRPQAVPPVQPMSQKELAAIGVASNPDSPTSYENLRDRIDGATAAGAKYLAVTTVEELLPLIENRESLEPQVRAFYAEGEGRGQLPFPPFTLAPVERQVWVDAKQVVVVSYETPGQVPRAVALRQNPDGQWLVDWPSAAAFNEVPLADFLARRDTTPRLFRLLASRDDYFNRAFADDREWICLRLQDVTGDHRIYAYARRGSAAAENLLKSGLVRGNATSPIMLRLRFPENAPAEDQVEVTEFLALGWIEIGLGAKEGVPLPAHPDAPK
ncbi:MAG: hypothetical protein ACKV19_01770 [Verrucomicrobiales bacterium]